jgi:predicted dehydrogenase
MGTGAVKVGIVGCGNICDIYFTNLARLHGVEVKACADKIPERAAEKAEKYGIAAVSVPELLNDDAIEIIVNLTIPAAHAEVARAALEAGKSVYSEKPMALERSEARELIQLARKRDLLLGGAPDTFMGAGIQTCRKLIDDGWIGKPVAGTAFMLCHGHETWHPDPEFYYKRGGGPMFDMGPYYLTALVALLGPVKRVTGATAITFPERVVTSEPKYGQRIRVDVPTHVAGLLEFADGAIVTLVTSFDVWHATQPPIEIYGTTGSIQVPDPNTFGGPVKLRRAGDDCWREIPLTHEFADNSRGIGVADMAIALRKSIEHRANGRQTFHVLDVMHALHESASGGTHAVVESTCQRPEPLPMDLPVNCLEH